MLEEAGPEAARIIKLWWIFFAIGSLVLLAVAALLLVACFAPRPERGESAGSGRLGRTLVVGGGATVVLLLIMLVASHTYSRPSVEEGGEALTIEVIGKRWWWAARYFDENGNPLFETANEFHIPVGIPVRFRLLSDDVIHSFWVPKLGGKVDLIRGRTNHLWLQADEPGIYRGQCAEFCGMQHAKMAFLIVAQPADEFARWLDAQAAPAIAPASDVGRRGREVFVRSQCADCHTIRGESIASSGSTVGPDLTHLASRRSLAAGSVPNRRGHLAGWLADPQGVKPGNLMPSVPLAAGDFSALLHYLETLR